MPFESTTRGAHAVSNVLFATLLRFALRMNAIRQVPEGLCKDCDGTGAGEALADLGEALSHGCQLPIKNCTSCSGVGMAIARVEVTTLGLLRLFPIAAAIYENRRRRTTRSFAPVFVPMPDLVGAPTRQLLSLIDALDTNAPTVDPRKPDMTASVRGSAH